jgi:hypothetical protein
MVRVILEKGQCAGTAGGSGLIGSGRASENKVKRRAERI